MQRSELVPVAERWTAQCHWEQGPQRSIVCGTEFQCLRVEASHLFRAGRSWGDYRAITDLRGFAARRFGDAKERRNTRVKTYFTVIE